ncbi:MAG TPA: hypothetical protein VJ870_19375 [Amycolatopsis sp.]|nr:hypothetical protein [Amycolatopsis sp.]
MIPLSTDELHDHADPIGSTLDFMVSGAAVGGPIAENALIVGGGATHED